jgi:hypothetical protein
MSPVRPLSATQTGGDPALVKALARVFRYQRLLDEGQYTSITEMAEAERLDRGHMGRLLQLTLLAPDLVEAILDGRQSDGVALPLMMRATPAEWDEQTLFPLGDARPGARRCIHGRSVGPSSGRGGATATSVVVV